MLLRSRASRILAAVVALFVGLGLWACANFRAGNRETHGAASPATSTSQPATSPTGAPLTITVKDLRNRNGALIFGVFRSADGFPTVEAKSVYWEVKDADADSVTFTPRLPPGRYGASVLHDENRSGDMDRGIAGIPLEGYGVTNNPKPPLRAATFDEATFTLPAEGKALTISLQYF